MASAAASLAAAGRGALAASAACSSAAAARAGGLLRSSSAAPATLRGHQPVRSFAAPNQSSAGAAAAERAFARSEASLNDLYMRAVEPKPPAR